MFDNNDIKQLEDKITEVHNNISSTLVKLRVGRANPQMVEDINVDYYGTNLPIKGLANIGVNQLTITIQPWDQGAVDPIFKALSSYSALGVMPIKEVNLVRIVLPPLTEDRRKELVKSLSATKEGFRVELRRLRDEIMGMLNDSFKDKEISEDEKFGYKETIEKIVTKANAIIEEAFEVKEKEIMTV
jgi:ribosome recycling factor